MAFLDIDKFLETAGVRSTKRSRKAIKRTLEWIKLYDPAYPTSLPTPFRGTHIETTTTGAIPWWDEHHDYTHHFDDIKKKYTGVYKVHMVVAHKVTITVTITYRLCDITEGLAIDDVHGSSTVEFNGVDECDKRPLLKAVALYCNLYTHIDRIPTDEYNVKTDLCSHVPCTKKRQRTE